MSKSRRVISLHAMAVAGVAALVLTPLSGAHLTRTQASEAAPVRGLDISAYQHAGAPVDWRLIARQGIRFVAIKLAEGTYYTNPYYSSDAKAAKAAGLAVMPYVFANPGIAYGDWTADFAVKVMRASGQLAGLPLVADLENNPYRKQDDCYGLGVPAMISWISGFVSRAHALTGQWPIIYTTAAWWRECTGLTSRFQRDPLWLAAYGGVPATVPSPWHDWTFWQYSNDGALPGLDQPDLDYYQPTGDLPSLGNAPAGKPPKKPAKKRKKPAAKKHPVKKPKPKAKAKKPKPKKPKPKKPKAKAKPKKPKPKKPKPKKPKAKAKKPKPKKPKAKAKAKKPKPKKKTQPKPKSPKHHAKKPPEHGHRPTPPKQKHKPRPKPRSNKPARRKP